MRFILFILYLFALAYSLSNFSFAKKNRKILLNSLIALFIFATLVSYFSEEKDERINELDRAFSSGQELFCQGNLITKEFYNLNRNSMSFVSKKELGTKILIFDIRDCEVKK